MLNGAEGALFDSIMPPNNTAARSSPKQRTKQSSLPPLPPKTSPTIVSPARSSRVNNALKAPLRSRGTGAVNLDVNAHLRTDPTGAFNALLKLVSSLSTRIGGCKYKLTAPEHALSMHLLSIVEPFIYQGARSLSTAKNPSAANRTIISGFAFQPTEILDAIMYFVDSKRDLLAVGVCCKRLHDVVFPRHFDYRVIRCKVSAISVWNHLSVHRSLARNVRTLEVLDERTKVASSSRVITSASSSSLGTSTTGTAVVPRGISQRDTDLDSTDDELRVRGIHAKQERYLINALQRMTGLKEFKWSCNHSPISVQRIWPTLMEKSGSSLEKMSVCNNLIFTGPGRDAAESSEGDSSDEDEYRAGRGKRSSAVSILSGVKTVTFTSTRHTYGAGRIPDISRIANLLDRCPNVENLVIDYQRPSGPTPSGFGHQPRIDPLFSIESDGTRWDRLRNIRFSGIWSLTPGSLAQFLSSHPTLEVLSLVDLKGVHRVELPLNSLPRLREVEATKEVLNGILESLCFSSPPADLALGEFVGDEVLRPLEVVKGFNLSGSHTLAAAATNRSPDQALLSNLKRHAKTIRCVELGGWHDMDDLRKLAKSIPGITYLDLGKRLGVNNAQRVGAVAPVTNLEEWLEILDDLQELRALHGVKLFYEVGALNAATGPVLPAHSISTTPVSSGSPWSATTVTTTSTHTTAPSTMHSTSESTVVGATKVHQPTQISTEKMSLMDRSRMKRNDCTASMLAWRCPKLRKVDHWDATWDGNGGTATHGKVIVLTRQTTRGAAATHHSTSMSMAADIVGVEGDAAGLRETAVVKWEVRRTKAVSAGPWD